MDTRNPEEKRESSEVTQIQKRVCSLAMTSALVLAFFFIAIHEKAIAKGLVLGTCFSILNFILMGRSISMTLGRSRTRASLIGFVSVLSRYVILAVPLLVALKYASFDFVAVAIGIFAVQIVTIIDYVVIRPILTGR